MTQEQHALTLTRREALTVTGVTEVVSFEDDAVMLRTAMGDLLVQGRQLHLKELSVAGGQVAVEGTVCALIYEEARPSGGWLHRLFG